MLLLHRCFFIWPFLFKAGLDVAAIYYSSLGVLFRLFRLQFPSSSFDNLQEAVSCESSAVPSFNLTDCSTGFSSDP